MKKIFCLLTFIFCSSLYFQQTLHAQNGASLGIQGILKKANGNAVEDGAYSLRFRLYEQAEGGAHIWEETQPEVEVVGGIYSATLGLIEALDIPFNTTYYLGVSVGSTSEMSPRIRLTTAPYALSLRGNTNKFPSSGTVEEDNTIISGKLAVGQTTLPATATLQVNGGVLARGGSPGSNGASNNGYAFSGNSGDNDSGVFSTANNEVSLYVNNTERLEANNTGVAVTGNMAVNSGNVSVNNGDVVLGSTGKVTYGALSDWRLVDTDIFASGNKQGWESTTSLFNTTAGTTTLLDFTDYFHGYALRPDNESDYLKKQFTINPSTVGPYTQIKVRFKYFFLDSWDAAGSEGSDVGIGGFSIDKAGTLLSVAWSQVGSVIDNGVEGLDFYDAASNYSDAATVGEMIITRRNTTDISYWIFFGARMAGTDDETYAIGDIEVWVR